MEALAPANVGHCDCGWGSRY